MKVFLICLVILKTVEMKTLLETKESYWNGFKTDFKKSYDSIEDEKLHKKAFWNNLKTISHHNYEFRRGRSTFLMGINKFADLTFLEYSNLFKANETVKQSSIKFLETHDIQPNFEMLFYGLANEVNSTSDEFVDSVFPTSFDWREKGAITPVKDQEYCGSCYAMSTIASIESQLFIKTGKLTQLSEQEVIDCAGEFGTFHCEGGIAFRVYDFVKENGGISDTLDYPYEAKAGKCRRNEKSKIEINIKGYGIVTSNENDVLMEAIIKFGPIMISMDTDHESFMLYSSGVYFEEKCTNDVNHGALLIGFGNENGNDYWIVKNSFGEKWGESGYVRIARGKSNDCSVSYVPLFPILN